MVLILGQAAGTEAGALVNETSCRRFETVPLPCILPAGSDSVSACPAAPKADDRHVFFGVSVPILGDEIVVPVQGLVPAVHSHATAFEGLLGEAPPKHVPGADGSVVRFLFTTAGIYFLAVVLRNVRARSEPNAAGIVRSPGMQQLFAPLRCITAAKLGTVLGTYALALGCGVGAVAASRLETSAAFGLNAIAVAPSLIAALFLLGLAIILFAAVRLLVKRARETGDRQAPARGRITRLLIEALTILGVGLGTLIVPLLSVLTAGGELSVFTVPLVAILGSAAVGAGTIRTLIGLELTGRISIKHCSVEHLTKSGSQWEGKRLEKLLQTLPVNVAERLHGSGIHLFVLGGIYVGIFVLSFVISDWSRLPASHIFSVSLSAVFLYWLVFREKVEDDLRLGPSLHTRKKITTLPLRPPGSDTAQVSAPPAPCTDQSQPKPSIILKETGR